MELSIPIKEKNRLTLEMLNPIIGDLSPKEINIILYMADNKRFILDKDLRTDIRMSLNMEKFNFNNYLFKLKRKKVLTIDNNFLILNPKILYILQQESFNIKFV